MRSYYCNSCFNWFESCQRKAPHTAEIDWSWYWYFKIYRKSKNSNRKSREKRIRLLIKSHSWGQRKWSTAPWFRVIKSISNSTPCWMLQANIGIFSSLGTIAIHFRSSRLARLENYWVFCFSLFQSAAQLWQQQQQSRRSRWQCRSSTPELFDANW